MEASGPAALSAHQERDHQVEPTQAQELCKSGWTVAQVADLEDGAQTAD